MRRRFVGIQVSESAWLAACLALSGGFQDAYTFLCRGGVFANAQTGNVVLMSAHLFKGEWAAAGRYVIPLLAYLLGTAAAQAIFFRFGKSKRLHWQQWVLLIEIFGLAAVGWIPDSLNPIANALVSFVCAMQVQAFHSVRGQSYASTMCIGNLRSGTENLHHYVHTKERKYLDSSLLYYGIIVSFIIGAVIGNVMVHIMHQRAILCCSVLLIVTFFIMFIDREKNI